MDDELALVNLSMDIFRKMRDQSQHPALTAYLKMLPEPMIKGSAHHLIRKYLSQRKEKTPLTDSEKSSLAALVCQQIFNESIQRVRNKTINASTENLDGAELFYRRALTHMAMERNSDAERLLRRAVEICPEFADGWEVLAEVYDRNGKTKLSELARNKFHELQQEK